MNKNIKDIIVITLLAFSIFLLPTVINYSSIDKKTDTFFERVDRDFDNCIKNANENSRDVYFCKEIRKSSELAFNSAKSVSDRYSNTSIIETVLFGVVLIVFILRRKIEDLETK